MEESSKKTEESAACRLRNDCGTKFEKTKMMNKEKEKEREREREREREKEKEKEKEKEREREKNQIE